jgi:hypothetical protein
VPFENAVGLIGLDLLASLSFFLAKAAPGNARQKIKIVTNTYNDRFILFPPHRRVRESLRK